MNCDVKLFMKYFVLATCLYVLGSCVIICIPGLRDLFLALNKADANTIRLAHKSTYITRFGWCGFSGFTFTLKCSLAAIMMCYIIYQEKLQHFYFNSSLLFICILGNLFYGRIGLVVSGVYFVTLFAMLWKKKEKEMCLRFMRMVCIGTMILALMAVISPKVRSWLYWAFQSFIDIFDWRWQIYFVKWRLLYGNGCGTIASAIVWRHLVSTFALLYSICFDLTNERIW